MQLQRGEVLGFRTGEEEAEVQCCLPVDMRERPGAEHYPIW